MSTACMSGWCRWVLRCRGYVSNTATARVSTVGGVGQVGVRMVSRVSVGCGDGSVSDAVRSMGAVTGVCLSDYVYVCELYDSAVMTMTTGVWAVCQVMVCATVSTMRCMLVSTVNGCITMCICTVCWCGYGASQDMMGYVCDGYGINGDGLRDVR